MFYQLSQSTKDLCEPILAFCPPRHIHGALRIGSSVMYISQYVLPTEPCDRSLRHYGRLPQALCTSASMFYQLSQSTKDLCEPISAFLSMSHSWNAPHRVWRYASKCRCIFRKHNLLYTVPGGLSIPWVKKFSFLLPRRGHFSEL